MAVHPVYTFYAELDDYSPKIWRRFEVNSNKTIAELGYTVMTLFEMQASHLFCITYDYRAEILDDLRKRYSAEALESVLGENLLADLPKPWYFELPSDEPYIAEDFKWCDASQYRIKDIVKKVPSMLAFIYDYGDDWQIKLTFEGHEKVKIHGGELPRVLAGEGFGIIEDCGGTLGLAVLAKAFKKKTGQQYKEYREWLGIDDLDLTVFDLDDLNFRLKKLPRIFKESYEYNYEPTQRSIDLIERKYKEDLPHQ